MTELHIDATKTVITVTVNQALANGLGSHVGGFRVMDGGVAVMVSNQIITGPSTIALTIAAPIAAVCTVSFASAEDAVGATVPYQNVAVPTSGPVKMPLLPFFNVVAG